MRFLLTGVKGQSGYNIVNEFKNRNTETRVVDAEVTPVSLDYFPAKAKRLNKQ